MDDKASQARSALRNRTGSISGSFELDHEAYHRNYARLYDIYTQLKFKREALNAEAFAVDELSVSRVISGVSLGAVKAGDAVGGRNTPSGGMITSTPGMLPAMLGLEAAIAELLIGLHDAYTSYVQGDEMASQSLSRAGEPVQSLPAGRAKML